jgi:dUTP pyrophosphatase
MKVRIINKSGFDLPKYETSGAAGFDIRASIKSEDVIRPGETVIVPTGLYVAVPKGYELQIRGRSGLAMKHAISITHGVGTIDSDYRGEIKVFLTNHGLLPFDIKPGDRVAQGIVAPVVQAELEEVKELDETERGTGGFGSTGRN